MSFPSGTERLEQAAIFDEASSDPLLGLEPQASARDDQLAEIQRMLREAGAPEVLLNHAAPYTDADAPYLYSGRGPHETINGSGGQANDGSESRLVSDIMIATNRPIGEVVADPNDDQTPSIIAQWRSHQYVLKPGAPSEVERDEIEQVGEDTYVRRQYGGVSGLGSFDGRLTSITLLLPGEQFGPNYPGRIMFRHVTFYRRGDGFRSENMNVSGPTLLNGALELRNLDLAYIHAVRTPAATVALPTSSIDQLVSSNTLVQLANAPRQVDLFEVGERAATEHPEIMNRVGEAMTAIAPLALEALSQPGVVDQAIRMFTNGVLKHPDNIGVLGRTLDTLDPNARFELAQILARGGQTEFATWYDEHFATLEEGIQSETFMRIRTLNLMQFAEAWDRSTDGTFREPDYEALDQDIASLKDHGAEAQLRYPLTSRIFRGLQTAAIAIFIEDFLMAQPAIAQALPSTTSPTND